MLAHHTIAPVFLLGGCLLRKLRLPKQNERRRLQGTLRGIHQMLVLLPEFSSVLFPSFGLALPRACKPHLLLDCFRLDPDRFHPNALPLDFLFLPVCYEATQVPVVKAHIEPQLRDWANGVIVTLLPIYRAPFAHVHVFFIAALFE